MSSINFDVSQFYDFAEQMGAADDKIRAEMLRAGNEAGQKGAQIAQSILASNGSIVTRGLYNSIQGFPAQASGDTVTVRYGPNENYPATWVEKGRGPVHARPGGMLRFRIKGVGPYIFTKSVGPARPRPFMAPSVARLRPIATKLFGDAVLRAVQGL